MENKENFQKTLLHLEEKKRRLVKLAVHQRDINNEVQLYSLRRKAREEQVNRTIRFATIADPFQSNSVVDKLFERGSSPTQATGQRDEKAC
jgi:hypothetical protein